jgi:hypothetical protein
MILTASDTTTGGGGLIGPISDRVGGDYVSVVAIGKGGSTVNFRVIRSDVEKP